MGLVCGGHIYVEWKTDEDGKIIRVEGHDSSACLWVLIGIGGRTMTLPAPSSLQLPFERLGIRPSLSG
jgi:hypothetical protein